MSRIECELTGEVVSSYQQYLKTDHWKMKREEFFLKVASKRCHVCFAESKLNVHHRTYKRLGKELDSDLIVFCQDCHHALHAIAKRLDANGFSDQFETTGICKAAKRIKPQAREYARNKVENKFGIDRIVRKKNGQEFKILSQ